MLDIFTEPEKSRKYKLTKDNVVAGIEIFSKASLYFRIVMRHLFSKNRNL